MAKKVTSIQLFVLEAMDESGSRFDAGHRPRGSLEALKKKGLVGGGRKTGWWLTADGRDWLAASRSAVG